MFELPRLLVITDRRMAEEDGCGSIDDVLIGAASAGANFFQIREKGSSPEEFARFVEHVVNILAGFPTTLVINDRADVALAVGADGVHRPGQGLPFATLRRLMEYRLVGASCHSSQEVEAAAAEGADYMTLSPIFETSSKPGYGPALTPARLERACRAVAAPVYALGGVEPANVEDCLDAGAHGVAVMGGIMRAEDPFEATRQYRRALGLA